MPILILDETEDSCEQKLNHNEGKTLRNSSSPSADVSKKLDKRNKFYSANVFEEENKEGRSSTDFNDHDQKLQMEEEEDFKLKTSSIGDHSN